MEKEEKINKQMKLKAVPIKEFHGGAEFFYRLEYTGGCELVIGFSHDNSDFPTEYARLKYFQLKYTAILCLYYDAVTEAVQAFVDCIEANKPLEEIRAWFIDTLMYLFYSEKIKEMVDNKELDIEKYLEELKQCYKDFSPLIEKEQEKQDEEVRRYRELERELEELRRGEKK